MTVFLELIVAAIALGFTYSLIALGFVVIFKATEVVNLAQGSLLGLGGLIIVTLQSSLGFVLAALIGVAGTALAAIIMERFLVRPMRGSPHIAPVIMTLGVDLFLITELTRQLGTSPHALATPWGGNVANFGALPIPESRLYAIAMAVVLMAALFLAMKYTRWGVASRASAEDLEAASLMGISMNRVSGLAWAVGGGLAAIGGIFLVAFPSGGVDGTTALVAMAAFPAAIIGGLDSVPGAVVGGVLVGFAQTFANGYQDQLAFLGGSFGEAAPFVLMILVLLIRPSGLFGTKEFNRV